MAKKEIVDTISASAGISKKDTAAVISSLLAAITAPAMKGALSGSQPLVHLNRKSPARTGHNPATGATIDISASSVPVFRAGKAFEDTLKKQPKAELAAQKHCRSRF